MLNKIKRILYAASPFNKSYPDIATDLLGFLAFIGGGVVLIAFLAFLAFIVWVIILILNFFGLQISI